ncbi:MAG: hypothetical protein QOD86_1841 [Miltoncostaeaceae bacterium]|nr:hypothetical protein [Miltoncostaeaceae bacterium]
MTDPRIDALLSASDPIRAGRLDAPAFASAAAELREAIASTPPELAAPAPRRPRWAGPRPTFRTAAVAVLGAAAIAVGVGVGIGRLGDGAPPAWGAELVRVAEASPRVLLDADGWTLTRADEFRVGEGETSFGRGEDRVDLRWTPERGFRELVRDRRASADFETTTAVLGRTAVVIRYTDSNAYVAMWRQDGSSLEFRDDDTTLEAFTALLGSLRGASVDEWLGAMPESVVRPDAYAAVVDEMLTGIPIPPGFDLAALRAGDGLVRDRYQLGARVAGAVACAWIDGWVAARKAGDTAAAAAATEAMATARGWPVLREMNAEGDYPEVLWELASAMPNNGTVPGGRPISLENAYVDGLGCPLP